MREGDVEPVRFIYLRISEPASYDRANRCELKYRASTPLAPITRVLFARAD